MHVHVSALTQLQAVDCYSAHLSSSSDGEWFYVFGPADTMSDTLAISGCNLQVLLG